MDRIHDYKLLDSLEDIEPTEFSGSVWRVAREGRDPLQPYPTGSGGRWDDGCFEVLYTSLEPGTAIAEIHYHLNRQPVFPTSHNYYSYEISVRTMKTLKFEDVESLETLGVPISLYSTPDYSQIASAVYPTTQAIGAAAHFLEFDGLIVPSARNRRPNLVLFPSKPSIDIELVSRSKKIVDWASL